MMRMRITTLMIAGGALLLVSACQPGDVTRRSGFKAQYATARTALEEGSYGRAIRSYKDLLKVSGPLEPRIRLEYAHALLRAEQYEAAAIEARTLATGQSGDNRAAALAVQGTAEHELALEQMAAQGRTPAVKARFQTAKDAFDELLKTNKKLDPLGSMAARRDAIRRELALF
ncbi:MAG: hypothetical protein ACWA47_06315 [Brevirhabdus sp.]